MGDENRPTMSAETIIRERNRGIKRGERDLLAGLGFKDREEALRFMSEHRRSAEGGPAPKGEAAATAAAKKDAPREAGESKVEYEERIAKLIAEQLAPIHKRFADEDEAKKKQSEAAEAKAREEAESAEATEEYEAEVAWFEEVAEGAGADPQKMKRLTRAYELALEELSPEDLKKKFGPGVSEERKKKNALAILAEIREESPGYFKKPEAKPEPKDEAAATDPSKPAAKPEAKPEPDPKKPATTGAPGSGPDAQAAAAAVPGAKRAPLDTRKLSDKQFREYKQNPDLFRQRYNQGLVEYEKK